MKVYRPYNKRNSKLGVSAHACMLSSKGGEQQNKHTSQRSANERGNLSLSVWLCILGWVHLSLLSLLPLPPLWPCMALPCTISSIRLWLEHSLSTIRLSLHPCHACTVRLSE